jgi:hypothetical protein
MNYQQLFETIKSYTENDFPNQDWTSPAGNSTVTLTQKEQIDTFIYQAEQRIFNSVQLPDFRKNVTGQSTTGNRFLNVPSDWLATFSLAAIDPVTGAQSYLLNKDVEFIRECYPVPTVTGLPKYYAIFDDTTFILGPTPDVDYNMELHYFYYPISIVNSPSGTSWLGDNFDSVLLYGSLLEAYTFMKGEPDVIQNYMARYNEALMMLKQLGEGKNRQDTYRTMQARIPVR